MGRSYTPSYTKTVANKRLILVDSSHKEKNHIKSITFHEDNFIVRSPGFVSTIVSYVHALFKNDNIVDKPFINESICNSFITVEKVKKGKRVTFSVLKVEVLLQGCRRFY